MSAEERDAIKMAYVEWADLAYEKQLCLVNWPVGIRAPAKGFRPRINLSRNILKDQLARRREAEQDPSVDDFIHIISWSDDDRKKSLSDKSDIPLVIDTDGQTVLTVLDSKKYKEAAQPTKTTATTRKSKLCKDKMPANLPPESDDEVQIMDPPPRTTTQARRDAPPAPSRPGVPSQRTRPQHAAVPPQPHRNEPPHQPDHEDDKEPPPQRRRTLACSPSPEGKPQEYWDTWADEHSFPRARPRGPRPEHLRAPATWPSGTVHRKHPEDHEEDQHWDVPATRRVPPAEDYRPPAHRDAAPLRRPPPANDYYHPSDRDMPAQRHPPTLKDYHDPIDHDVPL
ncbi:hypothetical protein Hypma_005264 [Hypsizygus marmoreus]|uniref:Uncharacterized protein n=1 Tax=Hypsizygus marmoreus TaxID=39966 RepID=A0A369JZD8_HYPMA|nr:hypothetical protein Hypma_005264 [Hypsizygus marmoreus]